MTYSPASLVLLFLALASGACQPPGEVPPQADDDDSSVSDDDDTSTDDDDTSADDDDASNDDDDSLGGQDYTDAYIPDYPDCSGNRFRLVLGDGSAIGPFEGFFDSPTSFANNFPQFTIRTGEEASWTALNGNYSEMTTGSDIPFASPPSAAGNVVLQASVQTTVIGGASSDLAGNYGLPANNLHGSVGGAVQFTSLPAPNAQASGTYSGIIQKIVGLSAQQVLLGVRGCFDAALTPNDGA